ncbi:MAG: DUF4982 domain-containing protein [Clostridia bacterium]|nr:DUF4982 domain-containing protein [Clostridia bacterium]
MREVTKINSGWLFCEGDLKVDRPYTKGPVYSQSKTERKLQGPASYNHNDVPEGWGAGTRELVSIGWKRVDLPHDFIINKAPDENENNTTGFFKYTNGWYRKHFKLNEEDMDKRISIIFDGVATHATVYLNGCLMKHNFCGYTTFEVDITDNCYFGEKENVLAVYVNTEEYEGWWYQGGGIYRDVWLKKTDRVCVDMYGVYAKPVKIDDNSWKVDIETTIRNENYEGRAKRIIAKSIIKDKDGNAVAEAQGSVLVGAKETGVARYTATVENPALWDVQSPNLYTVETVLIKNGKECDCVTDRIGFRTAYCDPEKGFFLNGKHVKIKGVCAHQDFGLTGLAVPENIFRYKVKLLKEMGANGYRCSHYPHPTATMDALDEMGFLVMDECRWMESTEEGIAQMEMMMKRDRNRPSVIFWSLGNEEPHHKTYVGQRINKSMYRRAKQLDDQRYIMAAVSNADGCKIFGCLDVIGVNYNLKLYDDIHKTYPDRSVFASECCATSTSRGFYYDANPDVTKVGYVNSLDHDTNAWFMGRENTWKFIMERDWVLGEYQWIAFEHRGETYWPRLCSQAGAIDLYMQKKDAFFVNQSHWSSTPMIHLAPHWNWCGMEGEEIKVVAYTNCDEAELFLNGKSIGRNRIEKFGHGEWLVPFEKGEIKVLGYINGQRVAEDKNITSGKSYALKLRLENDNAVNAGDIALFTCYVVDENGVEVPDAAPFVRFFSNNKGIIVGTGSDVCDHVPVNVPNRQMRMGRISVAVKLTGAEGELKLYAESDGLNKAFIKL